MNVTDVLASRPKILPATLRLCRVNSFARGAFLTRTPLYFASHWRLGRSFPCVKTILPNCPWCAGCERRDHAYIAAVVSSGSTAWSRVILELPAHSIPERNSLYNKPFTAERRSKRSQIIVNVADDLAGDVSHPTAIPAAEILRTIAKVYSLPDPLAYPTETEWLKALQIRIEDPNYSPAKSPTT
jgi:hypothetical protein